MTAPNTKGARSCRGHRTPLISCPRQRTEVNPLSIEPKCEDNAPNFSKFTHPVVPSGDPELTYYIGRDINELRSIG